MIDDDFQKALGNPSFGSDFDSANNALAMALDDVDLESPKRFDQMTEVEQKEFLADKRRKEEYGQVRLLAFEFLHRFRKEDCPKETDFIDVYGKDTVERDLEAVSGRKASFEQKASALSQAAEGVVFRSLEDYWLTDGIFTHSTAEYDDIKRGIDIVLEFDPEMIGSSRLAIGIDVTNDFTTKTKNRTYDKFKRKIANFEEFGRQMVKYYEGEYEYLNRKTSKKQIRRGGIEVVPIVISIGQDELRDLLISYDNIDNKETKRSPSDEIASHRARAIVILQIVEQLKMYESLYRKTSFQNRDERRKKEIDYKVQTITKMVEFFLSKVTEEETKEAQKDLRLQNIKSWSEFKIKETLDFLKQ